MDSKNLYIYSYVSHIRESSAKLFFFINKVGKLFIYLFCMFDVVIVLKSTVTVKGV